MKKYIRGKVVAFIDYANIKAWAMNKGLFVDLKVLFDILSKSGIKKILFYYGTDIKNPKSKVFLDKLALIGYEIRTKPVQYFHINLFDLLNKPVNKQLLDRMNPMKRKVFIEEIKRLTKNKTQILLPKANFDVEITMDMILLRDFDTYILFSGDGDFKPLISYIKSRGKKTIIIAGRKFLSGKLIQSADTFITLERFSEKYKKVFYKKASPAKSGT